MGRPLPLRAISSYTGGSTCVLARVMHDYDRRKTASATLAKLKRAAPHFRKALQDLFRENRGGNPKIVSAITDAGKKFNEVIDLLEVVEHETTQELRERTFIFKRLRRSRLAMSKIAERVANRYKAAASTPRGLIWLIYELVKDSGGVAFLVEGLKRSVSLTSWDKNEFYRGEGDEVLLEYIFDRAKDSGAVKFMAGLAEKFLPTYNGADIDPDSVRVGLVGGYPELEFTAYGPSFHRYGSDDAVEDYRYEQDIPMSEMVEHSYIGDIGSELFELMQYLGGDAWYSGPTQEESEYGGYYDYYQYKCRASWPKVNAEEALRKAVGKMIIKAGESIEWKAEEDYDYEPPGEFIVKAGDELVIERRRGGWPKELKKGVQLKVLRSGRSGNKVPVQIKGNNEKLYFRAYLQKGKLHLFDMFNRKSYLQVRKA